MARKKTLSKKHHKANNKLLILLILFLLFILTVVYITTDGSFRDKYSLEKMENDVRNSDVVIPDASVSAKLTNGKATFEVDGSEGSVELTPPIFFKKISNGYDVFGVMTHNTGGSGEFVSIAYFKKTKEGIKFQTSYPVGDRVVINNIVKGEKSKNGYEIIVNYLDRKPNEPMTAVPTIKTSLILSISTE